MFHVRQERPPCTSCTGSKVYIVILYRRIFFGKMGIFIALEGFVNEKSLSNVGILLAWIEAI